MCAIAFKDVYDLFCFFYSPRGYGYSEQNGTQTIYSKNIYNNVKRCLEMKTVQKTEQDNISIKQRKNNKLYNKTDNIR